MRIITLMGFVAGLALAAPAAAGCRIALALAFDVSRSVSNKEYGIQVSGLVAALADPVVRAAFLRPRDHVAITVYEWSGRDYQAVIVGWSDIRSGADLDAVSAQMMAHERWPKGLATGLGAAVEFGLALFDSAPACDKRVLDVAGDGRNNDGLQLADIFARANSGDLVINALAIGQHESDLVDYFQAELIRGPGAFVEVARQHTDFPVAIRRKLIRELTDQLASLRAPGG